MEVNYVDIGLRIKRFRIQKNITQEKLAELTKISTPHISHIENGTTKLGLPTIVKIANALKVSVDELLCDSLVASSRIYHSELSQLISDCTQYELMSAVDIVTMMKKILRNKEDYEV